MNFEDLERARKNRELIADMRREELAGIKPATTPRQEPVYKPKKGYHQKKVVL